ncbi:MAG: tetratricopeptide repeat protein, partial [Hydrogenophaga sp.]|nr:tetratricopeptide repeat protein [Hydrogenophaga sp.]
MQLAQALTADNKQEEALTYYKKTIEYNPKNQEALYQLGTSFFKKNDYTNAILYLKQYVTLNDANSEILAQLCTAYTKLGNTQKATQYQQKIVAINPTEQGYLQLGNLFLQQGNYTQAIESYNQVLTKNAKNSEAYLHKAQALQKSACLKDALNTYDQLLAHYRNHPQALLEKASLLAKIGDTNAAIATYQQLLPMVPAQKKESLHYTMGNVYRKGGNLTQARDVFQNIIKQNPNHAHAILGLGKTYIALGDYALGWPLMAQYNQLTNSHGTRLLTNKNQIKGKKIFIGAEWMLEDMVQLARYAKNIKDAGGSVIMQTPPQLYALLKTCPFVDTIIGCNENISPAYHAYIPITSLPAL